MKTKTHRRGSAPEDSIPSSFQVILSSFAGCFSRPSLANFIALTTGWVSCQGRHCITRMIQAGGAVGWKHFSCFHRFLSRAKWSADDLGAVVLQLLQPWLGDEIEALLDDTLCHRGGPRIFGAGMHHDGANSKSGWKQLAFGHSWVVLAIWLPLPWDPERGKAVPILFRLYRSLKRCPEKEYKKRTELGRELVEVLRSWLPDGKRLHVIGDREYACRTLVRSLPEDVHFTGPAPMDAALYEPVKSYCGMGRPRKKGARLPSPKQRARRKSGWRKRNVHIYGRDVKLLVQTWTCLWYTAAGTRLVRMVLTRDPKGHAEDRVFFTTEVDASVELILQRYAHRWLIEVCFREAKQLLGIEDPQNGWSRGKKERKKPGLRPRGSRGQQAVLRTVPLAWTVYALVIIWYLKAGRWESDVRKAREAAPWYGQKSAPSFADMLTALRVELTARRLIDDPADLGALRKTRNRLYRCLSAA